MAPATSVLTFFAAKRRENARWMQGCVFWWADAGALALCSVLGCAKASANGMTALIAMNLGMFTGVVGEIPLAFRRDQHFYTTAALVGVGVQAVTQPLLGQNSLLLGAACVLATRLISCRFDLRWPAFSELES